MNNLVLTTPAFGNGLKIFADSEIAAISMRIWSSFCYAYGLGVSVETRHMSRHSMQTGNADSGPACFTMIIHQCRMDAGNTLACFYINFQEISYTNNTTVVTNAEHVDEELIRRVQNGDQHAFGLLVRKYERKIGYVISRYISDPHEVEDIAQETFIKAYRAMERFRGDSAFYTWLYRIAVNTSKNFLVSKKRRPPDSDLDASDIESSGFAQVMHDTDTPEAGVLSREIAQTVTDTLDNLPEELRLALKLRELQGLSYEEIAERMQCPLGTVRSRIFRAREAVDKELQPLLA